MTKTFKAWAINTNSKDCHGFIGRYWWFYGEAPHIPLNIEGCQTSLFTTRKLAREALPDVKKAFPNAKVSRVFVSIYEI